MSNKSKSKQEEAMQFLDDLDSLSPDAASENGPQGTSPAAHEGEAEDVLKFLDEITQKSAEPTRMTAPHLDRPSSRAGTPTLRKSTERIRVGTPTLHGATSATTLKPASNSTANTNTATSPSPGWGWGSVWSTASAAIQQAKTVVDEQVKHLPQPEQAKKWSEGIAGYVKKEQLEKFGQDFKNVGLSTLTDLLNAVAPPISEHEVIQVWLSHDMQGYEGVESLVYKAMARVMEQVEGGDLIVNKGNESRPKESGSSLERNLNAVDGLDEAMKLAEANVDELIKANSQPVETKALSAQNPTTYSYVYLRIQPFYTPMSTKSEKVSESTHLQFLLYLSDPDHNLVHSTTTQAVPRKWLELWEKHDWVEDLVVEVLRVGVEVIGQEYVVARMGWVKEGSENETVATAANSEADATTVA